MNALDLLHVLLHPQAPLARRTDAALPGWNGTPEPELPIRPASDEDAARAAYDAQCRRVRKASYLAAPSQRFRVR